ncbi:MAG: hypothetical protein M1822_002525 [Bathelium mastoideum]|nr:MAG: hypothetical protein M1822_002525 [Bathelium mastoideum]
MVVNSCRIAIRNSLRHPLSLAKDPRPECGEWRIPPTLKIPLDQESIFELVEVDSTKGINASVHYEIDVPEYEDTKWRITVQCISQEGRTKLIPSSTFLPSQGQSQPCHLFSFDPPFLQSESQSFEVRLDVKYDYTLRTNSHITEVRMPARFITSHISNVAREAPTASTSIEDDTIIWKADSLATFEDNSDSLFSGSYYPVGVDVSNGSHAVLKMRFNVSDEKLLGVPLQIYGDNDVSPKVVRQQETRPVIFNMTGEWDIRLKVDPSWARRDVPWGVAGNVVWRICVIETGQLIGLNSSRLEFYAFSPKIAPLFPKSLVPIMLLRRFVLSRKTWTPDFSWEGYCCSLAFHDFAFRYDIWDGRPSYGRVNNDGVYFRLHAYLSNIKAGPKLVNCYDQACIMKICLSLSPAIDSLEWIFMKPFGFIKTTVLIGRGVCNNPFYGQAGRSKQRLCESNLPTRSKFNNHAFVRVGGADGKIVDACSGPHLGDETLGHFIDASIDKVEGSIFGGERDICILNSDLRLDLETREILPRI